MKSKREKLFIASLVIAAFCLRLLWIFHLDNSIDVWGDWWDEIASHLAAGRGFFIANPFNPGAVPYYSWRPPAFPLFLAGIYAVFGHSFLHAKIGLAVISSFSVLFGYLAASRLFGPAAGRLTAVAMAIYPTFIFFTGYLAPETLTLFFILLTVFFLTRRMDSPAVRDFLFAGLALGCAVMCRTIMALLFVFIPIWMVLLYGRSKDVLKKSVLLLAGMSVAILPWIVRNYRIHNAFVFHSTDAGQALFINNNPESFTLEPSGTAFVYDPKEFISMSEVETTRIFIKRTKDFIKHNPLTYLRYVSKRFINFWRPIPYTISGPGQAYSKIHQIMSGVYTVPIFVFAFIGFFYSMEKWKRLFVLYVLVFYYSGTYILVRAIIRYRVPIEPYLIMFAAYGFSMLRQKLYTTAEKSGKAL